MVERRDNVIDMEKARERKQQAAADEAGLLAEMTDARNAERVVECHGQDIIVVPNGENRPVSVLVWDGTRFDGSDPGVLKALCLETMSAGREATDDLALQKHFVRSMNAGRVRAAEELVRVDRSLLRRRDLLDADPWSLNCLNGTVDLKTGRLRKHQRADLITQLAPVEHDPAATATEWDRFLQRVLPDPKLRAFFQRLCGYAMTGLTREEKLPICWGGGANGKSTALNTLAYVLGHDYAWAAPSGFMYLNKHNNDDLATANLRGKRWVNCLEGNVGGALNEEFVKRQSGGDDLNGRFHYQNFTVFGATHQTFIACNDKPSIRGTDEATRRRVLLIPWTVEIPPEERDRGLKAALAREVAGVLNWMVQGCLDWQRDGLDPPPEVLVATEEYFEEEDLLGAWLDWSQAEVGDDAWDKFGVLYGSFKTWCKDNGFREWNGKRFGAGLDQRGFKSARRGGGVSVRLGLRLPGGGTDEF